MTDAVLVVNAGSSSLKFSAYAASDVSQPPLLLEGQIEAIGTRPRLVARDANSATLIDKSYDPSVVKGHEEAIATIASWLGMLGRRVHLVAAGHRVVHGGAGSVSPALINDRLLASLERLTPLMPLHQPANLAAIRALRARNPALPQVACFDTAFHQGHSELADRFAIPEALYREGVRRYGFHGLSYEYIAQRLPDVAPTIAGGKVIVAHLGSGASLCAMKAGHSVDTTMSFSALDGLPMGTRCGSLDPGVLIYLIREKGLSPDVVERMLYHECGLRGLSNVSSDVRDLLASKERSAKLALDYFVYQVCRQMGALAAVLEGLDAIIFTAGIGEHSPEIRERICARVAWLGLRLDATANSLGGPRITTSESAVSAWVIPTNEELVIARHTLDLIRPLSPALIH
jgi:acetate kinase